MHLETIAVYWESKVKIYSITLVTDLSMLRVTYPIETTEKGRKITRGFRRFSSAL